MKNRLTQFGKKPMTWGAYGKLCLVTLGISIVYTIGWLIYWLKPFKKKEENKFGRED